jgi:alpha-L-glutamate ligase-like protein
MWELIGVEEDLGALSEFVIKPSQGSGGGGIVVVAGRDGPLWKTLGGKSYSLLELKKHLADILFGVYSFDLTDAAVVEERVRQHPEMQELSPLGLADIRLIMFHARHVMAMSRVPTAASGGRANLHQGALGIGIDIETGQTVHAIHARKPIHIHPDTGIELLGRRIPQWDTVLSIAHSAALALPLKYIGLDISIAESGPILLEANVRPGLEIQNANRRSLLDSLLASV